jgi:hypothetical protein
MMFYAGLRNILIGRGYSEAAVTQMRKPEMIKILESHPDFQATKPVLVELIEGLSPSFQVVFLPKFHCEVITTARKVTSVS